MAPAPKRVPDDPEAPVATRSDDPTASQLDDPAQSGDRQVLATRGADPDAQVESQSTAREATGYTHEHPTAEEVALEAYAIYVAGGRQDGHDLADWLEAERRLLARRK
jgi:hypothetical protein